MICEGCPLLQFCDNDKVLAARSVALETVGDAVTPEGLQNFFIKKKQAIGVLACIHRGYVLGECELVEDQYDNEEEAQAAATTGFTRYNVPYKGKL